jgi:acetyltransferase-like isoleucine patch superfamily enzyme
MIALERPGSIKQINPLTNTRPGYSSWYYAVRRVGNYIRSLFYFCWRYRWVKRKGMVRIPWNVELWSPHRDIELGEAVQFGRNCVVHCDIRFGSKILISQNVAFINRDDHQFRVLGKAIWDSPRGDALKTVVEDDVWIGHGAIILSGVTIGRGSVVAAGSVVAKNVPRYAIVAGNPAKVIGQRFSADDIHRHEQLLGYEK